MEMGVIITVLVGIIALIAYKRGKDKAETDFLEEIVKSNEDRKTIRNMSDSELDDELRNYWK